MAWSGDVVEWCVMSQYRRMFVDGNLLCKVLAHRATFTLTCDLNGQGEDTSRIRSRIVLALTIPFPISPLLCSLSLTYGSALSSCLRVRVREDAQLAALSRSNKWVEKHTADNVPYYFEPSSETVTWEKPDCLKSAAEIETNSGPWAWVSSLRISGYVS